MLSVMPQALFIIFGTRGISCNELGNAYLNKQKVLGRMPDGINDQQEQELVRCSVWPMKVHLAWYSCIQCAIPFE